MEFIPGAGEAGFQVDCGIRIHGNASREPAKTPKHSFRLFFRGDYGPARLEASVYPESAVTSFKQLVLRADFNNSWLHWLPAQRTRGTRIRDGWTKETWRAMGHAGSHTRYVHLYLNGLYWGVYDVGERIDATFAANYFGGDPEDYDAMGSKPTWAIDGDRAAYDAMVSAVRFRDLTVLDHYVAARAQLDVINHIDYLLLNFYGGNEDWGFDSNWNAVRRRDPGGSYRYIPWDCEQLLTNPNYNRVNQTSVPSGLHTNLVRSAEYRLAFADRVHQHLFNQGELSIPAATERWLRHAAQVEHAVLAESARWGVYRRDVHQYRDPPYPRYTSKAHWQVEIDRVTHDYFPRRHDIFLEQLRNAGLYPDLDAPELSPVAGPVRAGTLLEFSAPAGLVYFTTRGEDPRVFGTGAIAPSAQPYTGPILVEDQLTLKARTYLRGEWSAMNHATFEVAAPAPYPLGEAGPYRFDRWDADAPAGTYPPHMMFYQMAGSDPGLEVEPDSVWALPYDLSNRSRINGLGADGFAMINTANPQEADGAGYLGAAVLAIDTRGQDDIQVAWTAGTVLPNSRVYGLRLQWRVGDEGPFADLLDAAGGPVEYVRHEQAGHSAVLGPVSLPAAANDQPLVELRWKYHHLSGDSGPRAQLRVGTIQVTAGHPAPETLVLVEAPAAAQTGWPMGPVMIEVRGENDLLATGYDGWVEIGVLDRSDALSGELVRQVKGGVVVFEDLAFTQPGAQRLTVSAEGLVAAVSDAIAVIGVTEAILPRTLQGQQPENLERVPFAFRLGLAGLEPNATYRYGNRVVTIDDPPEQDGAGNMIFVRTDRFGFIRNTDSPRFRPDDRYVRHGELTTDSEGRFAGWFITEPTGNPRFTPGNTVFMRLLLNDGAGGETASHSLTAPSPVIVHAWGTSENEGSAVYGVSAAAGGNFVVLYEDAEGSTRPVSATVVEATGSEVDSRYAGFYEGIVAGRSGRWGVLLPNGLPNGIRRIEERDRLTGQLISLFVSPAGIRPTSQLGAGATAVGIRVPGPADGGFVHWQAGQFTLAQLTDDAISGLWAQPNLEGVPNLLAFAYGLDPFAPDLTGLPVGSWLEIDGAAFLQVQYRRPIGGFGIDHFVHLSTDLVEWHAPGPETGLTMVTEPAGDGLNYRVTLRLPIAPGAIEYYLRFSLGLR